MNNFLIIALSGVEQGNSESLLNWSIVIGILVVAVNGLISYSTKIVFDKKFAKIQAALSKENISYQIQTAEYTKYKYDKIVSLYISLTEIKKYFNNNYSPPFIDETIDKEQVVKLYGLVDSARERLQESSLFFENDNLEKNVLSFLSITEMGASNLSEIHRFQDGYERIEAGYIFTDVFTQIWLDKEATIKCFNSNVEAFVESIGKVDEKFNELRKAFKLELVGVSIA